MPLNLKFECYFKQSWIIISRSKLAHLKFPPIFLYKWGSSIIQSSQYLYQTRYKFPGWEIFHSFSSLTPINKTIIPLSPLQLISKGNIATSNVEESNNHLEIRIDAKQILEEGPLVFLSKCLCAAFESAAIMDKKSLPGTSCLTWSLIPEVQGIVSSYCDLLVQEISPQVFIFNYTSFSQSALLNLLYNLSRQSKIRGKLFIIKA